MKLVFLTDSLKFSGGRKLMLEYAAFLSQKGHDVTTLVQDPTGGLEKIVDYKIVQNFAPSNIPRCDIIVATTPNEVRDAFNSQKGVVVHFCQGFEVADLEQRIASLLVPPRYLGHNSIWAKLALFRKRLSWRSKMRRINNIYKLPSHLIVVSPHLKAELEKRYGKPVRLCRNGFHSESFFPSQNFEWGDFSPQNPMKIINVGPLDVSFKGVPFTFDAIRILKQQGAPIHFTRVSPKLTKDEKKTAFVDEFYEIMTQDQLGDLYRRSHVLVSNSTEGEGFGLPAMEGLGSGLVCVLSDISSYRNFGRGRRDYCLFVPEFDSRATVDALSQLLEMKKDKALAYRKAGLEVASEFSHEKACEDFESALEELLKNKRHAS